MAYRQHQSALPILQSAKSFHGSVVDLVGNTQVSKGLNSPSPSLLRQQHLSCLSLALLAQISPVEGRIQKILPRWQSITSDRWVLQIAHHGFALLFISTPPRNPSHTRAALRGALVHSLAEVQALLSRVATKTALASKIWTGCYSCYLLVLRWPILDLRPFKAFLWKDKFKMLTLTKILSALDPNNWMVSLDLQDHRCPCSQSTAALTTTSDGKGISPVRSCKTFWSTPQNLHL